MLTTPAQPDFVQGPPRAHEWDLRALLLRMLLQLRYVKDLVRLLRRSPYFREACGYRDRVPTEAH